MKKSVEIDIHLTYNCNLRCMHCSVVDYRDLHYLTEVYMPGKELKELRYDQFINFIEILENSSLDFKPIIHFSPNIGESTVHPDFLKIWNRISEMSDVNMMLTSNGVLLWKYLREMNLEKCKSVIISIDGGTKEAHERMRGANTFKNTIKSLEMLNDIKGGDKEFYLQINTTLTKLNIDTLPKLPYLFENLESENIILNLLKFFPDTGNGFQNRKLLEISEKDIKRYLPQFVESINNVNKRRKRANKSPIKWRMELFTLIEQMRLVKGLSGLRYSSLLFEFSPKWMGNCGAYNLRRIYIDPYGYLLPCLNFAEPDMREKFFEFAGSVSIPNFIVERYATLKDILQTPFFTLAVKWLRSLYMGLPCRKCHLHNSCTVCPIYASVRGVPDVCYSD